MTKSAGAQPVMSKVQSGLNDGLTQYHGAVHNSTSNTTHWTGTDCGLPDFTGPVKAWCNNFRPMGDVG